MYEKLSKRHRLCRFLAGFSRASLALAFLGTQYRDGEAAGRRYL